MHTRSSSVWSPATHNTDTLQRLSPATDNGQRTTDKSQIQVNVGKCRYFSGGGGPRFPFSAFRFPLFHSSILYALFSTLFGFVSPAMAQSTYENYTFTTFAGPVESGSGAVDGAANVARFGAPAGVAADGAGNIYVADTVNDTIRKILPDGTVTTLAGLAGVQGTNDGLGAAARFKDPYGVAVDSNGNVFVADTGNQTIRKISPVGEVTTFAGAPGTRGSVNGTGTAARFYNPYGIIIDASNNLYVADTFNFTIRKITPAAAVTTIAGSAGVAGHADKTGTSATFYRPASLTMDASGNIYVADTGNDIIRKIAPGGAVTTLAGMPDTNGVADGTNGTAQFYNPYGITVGSDGNIYVADTLNDTIRQITPSGVVTTFAGVAGTGGNSDGTGTNALFRDPLGLAATGTNILIGDFGNASVRKISMDAIVATVAGFSGGPGTNDGIGSAARFNSPTDLAFDANGNMYVADSVNNTIRKIAPDLTVTTLAGNPAVRGSNDATGAAASFYNPNGLAVDNSGNVIVADTFNSTIRQVTPDGIVSTLAGLAGVNSTNDGVGTNAQFDVPLSVAVDSSNNIYVADTHNNSIREITAGNQVTTIAGSPVGTGGSVNGQGLAAQFLDPEKITLDPDGNIYVADSENSMIRKIDLGRNVTTLAGQAGVTGSADGNVSNATFFSPFGVVRDTNGNLFISDTGNKILRKITPAGVVTTIAGTPGVQGSADGTGSDAQFIQPDGLAVDNQGNIYVADGGTHSIRRGYPAPPDVPVVDVTNGDIGVTLHFSISNETTTSWSWTLIRQPSASTNQIVGANTDTPTFIPDVEDTYIVRFQGWDNSGRTTIRRLTLHAHNGRRLTVLEKGGGTVKPDLNGSLLQIGNVYSMTAKAVPGSTFSNWTAIIGKNTPLVITNSPTISFAMQNDLTLIANFHDHQNPTVLITSPKSRQFASNAVFSVTGTAKDNDSVAAVYYQLNGGAWTNANGTSNWSAQVALNPGGNTVLAYAQDPSGNVSTTNRTAFDYVPSARLSITGTGAGTLSPNYVGALLAIGTNYSITAKAAKGYIFSNWVDYAGNVATTNPVLKFMMQSNSAFVVNFSRNGHFFAQGQYAGLFYDTNNLTATNSGFFSAALTADSAFTAKLLLGGSSISISGQFSTNGVFSNSVPVKNSSPITLQLQLDLAGKGLITGTISGSGWTNSLLAYQLVYSAANPPSQEFQRFTLVIPGGEDSSTQPGGNSYGNITVDNLGTVTFTGVLADGSKAAQKTFLSKDGQWPFYISSANGLGVTLGWLTFSPGQAGTLDGHVYWNKLPGSGLYPDGFNFTNGIDTSGSFYAFYIGRRSLKLTNCMMVLQQAGISPPITNYFTLNANDTLTSTNGLKASIDVITGIFKGAIRNPADNTSIPVDGAVLQSQTNAFGFFVNSNQSGSVYIGAPPQ